MAGAADWVEYARKSYADKLKRDIAEQKKTDAADVRRMADFINKMLGEQGRIEGITLRYDHPEFPMMFTFANRNRGSYAVTRICPECNKEQHIPVTYQHEVGEIIVNGYPPHGCQPTKS